MSDIYVGLKAQNIDIGAEMPEITGIRLVVDSDHEYVVGDAAGRMIEVECPWGTEDMAKSILATMSDLQYRPYTAERAMLDPAFELGDSVMVGGVSSAIINSDINYNGAALANIDAPALDEIDDEYPARQIKASSFERQLAYTRSLISKTVDSITLSVTDEDGEVSIQLKAGDKELGTPGTIDLTGVVTFSALAGEPTGTTKINGGWIDTDTLTVKTAVASKLEGEDIVISHDGRGEDFHFYVSSADLHLKGTYPIYITSTKGHVCLQGGGGASMEVYKNVYVKGNLRPKTGGSYALGNSKFIWTEIYAETGEVDTSDRNKKNSIEALPDKYVAMFDALDPRRYKLNSGTSDRYHVGFISQEVEEAMTAAGITSQEFGGFVKDVDEDGNEVYMLRYSEFVAILAAKVQAMQKEIDTLKERIS